MDVINTERAILATFLSANEYGENLDEVYELDTRAFTSKFNKRVAEQINQVVDGAYGFLSFELEEKVKGTPFEQDWIYILAQTNLGLGYSKKYHDKLLKKNILKGLK